MSSTSVAGSLQGFRWNSEESVAYEAALEAINGAVGAYTARIVAEMAAPVCNQQVLTGLEAGQARCVQARRRLHPTDHEAVATTRREFAELTRSVRASGQ
jgi:hypothetical protein